MQKDYKVVDNTLFFKKKSVTFIYPIRYVKVFNAYFVVLLEIPYKKEYNRNIFLLDQGLNIIWQVEEFSAHKGQGRPYTSVGVNGNDIEVFNSIGYFCKLDVNNGKILDIEFVK